MLLSLSNKKKINKVNTWNIKDNVQGEQSDPFDWLSI